MKQITFADLKKTIESGNMPEDTPITFLFRENFPDDEGQDIEYIPTSIWICGEDNNRYISLVGVIPPEIDELSYQFEDEENPTLN